MKRFHVRYKETINATLGWIGALLILSAYFLVSFGIMQADQVSWQLLNLFGSAGIVISALPKKDWPAMWLNIIFAAIALIALIRLLTLI